MYCFTFLQLHIIYKCKHIKPVIIYICIFIVLFYTFVNNYHKQYLSNRWQTCFALTVHTNKNVKSLLNFSFLQLSSASFLQQKIILCNALKYFI